jgi:hypothetical protein
VTVNHQSASLVAAPPIVYVRLGCWVHVRLVPPVELDRAHTRQKGDGNRWLNRDNKVRDEILIKPDPKKVNVGDEFDYAIAVDGVGVLDPRIVIQ